VIRRPLLHARVIGLALALAAQALAPDASAAGPKETAARKALKKALEDDYLQTRFDDAENRLRAAIQSCGTACSAQLRAELHAALGSILAGGKKELEDARDEFIEALQLDPRVQPHPDVLTAEVTFAYEQAKKKLKGPAAPPADLPDKPADEPKAEPRKPQKARPEPAKEPAPDGPKKVSTEWGEPKDKDTKDDAKDKPEEPPPKPARKNWITLTFSPDLSIVSGSNVCTKESRETSHYACVRNDAARTAYVGTPTLDNGDNINAGVGLATLRVMVGYDRVLADNISIGARVGFAFNGASGGSSSFLPVHVEARLGFWPGKTPFVGNVVRPYFTLSGGLAQIDTKVKVQVLEDGAVCGAKSAGNTNSPCTIPSSDDHLEDRVQTLTVYRQAGLGFGSVGFGVQFAPTAAVALYLAVRGSVTFPVVTGVISPEGGLSLGF